MFTSRCFRIDFLVAPSSRFHTVSTVLFHKYGGANYGVANFMSHFSMFFPTKVNVKFSNLNTIHSLVIGVILCSFPTCPIIYPMRLFYYCTGRPSNTISSGDLKCYVGFQRVTYEPFEHCDFFEPQGCSWISPYQTMNNLGYIQV